MTPSHPAPTRMSQATVVVALTLLLGIQPVTTDLYLPALPRSRAVRCRRRRGAADAVGADHLLRARRSSSAGRSPTVSAAGRCCWRPGAVHASPALGGALAPTIEALIAWRALQGVALAAAVTCGRSIVRDLYQPHEGARVMSRGAQRPGHARDVEPAARRRARDWRGWRAALAPWRCSACSRWLRRVALRRDGAAAQPLATHPGALLRNWARGAAPPDLPRLDGAAVRELWRPVLRARRLVVRLHRRARRRARLRRRPRESVAYIAGTLLCRVCCSATATRSRACRRGAYSASAAACGWPCCSSAGVHSVGALLLPQWLYCVGHGVHQPCGQAGVTARSPRRPARRRRCRASR